MARLCQDFSKIGIIDEGHTLASTFGLQVTNTLNFGGIFRSKSDLVEINVFVILRFRHYYRHILLLKWLKPSAPNGATGLLLASTFGLQVAAHLAYKEEDHTGTSINDVRQFSVFLTPTSHWLYRSYYAKKMRAQY